MEKNKEKNSVLSVCSVVNDSEAHEISHFLIKLNNITFRNADYNQPFYE